MLFPQPFDGSMHLIWQYHDQFMASKLLLRLVWAAHSHNTLHSDKSVLFQGCPIGDFKAARERTQLHTQASRRKITGKLPFN
jgi:hypothetical protein